MNSEGVLGILIKWVDGKTEATRDYDNLSESDFEVLNWYKVCPVTDGRVIDFTGAPDADKLEWLMYAEGERLTDFDQNLYIENIVRRPTKQKDSVLVNYNKYLNIYTISKRTKPEIIESIRQLENEANISVLNEAERNKLVMLQGAVQAKISNGVALNEYEQNVYTRMLEVSEKALINASNAANLIGQVDAFLAGTANIDLKSGWETDNITELGYPFNS